eukprot:744811-Prymnesium_polylepis.1
MSAAGEGHVAAARDGNMDPAGTAAADALLCMSISSEDKDGTLPDESTAATEGAAGAAEVPDADKETRSAERSVDPRVFRQVNAPFLCPQRVAGRRGCHAGLPADGRVGAAADQRALPAGRYHPGGQAQASAGRRGAHQRAGAPRVRRVRPGQACEGPARGRGGFRLHHRGPPRHRAAQGGGADARRVGAQSRDRRKEKGRRAEEHGARQEVEAADEGQLGGRARYRARCAGDRHEARSGSRGA